MLIQIACLAATLLPPQGGAPQPAAAARAADPFAAVLPSSTLVYVHVGDLATQMPALQQTALARVLAAAPIPADARAKWSEIVGRASELTGLDEAQLADAFAHGMTLALTGLDADGTPHLVFGARLAGDPATWARALEKAARGAGATAKDHAGIATWKLPLGDDELALCVCDNTLMAASSDADLRAAIDRSRAAKGASLADQPEFREVVASAGSDALLTCFVQTAALGNELLRRLTGPELDATRKVLKALDTQRITAVGYGLRIEDGRFADHTRVFFPAPRTGLLGALCGAGTPLGSDCARLIPADVEAFSVGQIDLKSIFKETIALVGNVDPNAATMVQGALRALASNVGVDVEQDVLQSLGQRFASLQWPSDGDHLEAALVFETRDAWRLEKAISRLLGAVNMHPKSRAFRGHNVYSLDLPMLRSAEIRMTPGFGFTDTHFVLASSDRAMRSALQQLDEPTQNAQATALLSRLPAGTIAASRVSLAATLQTALDRLEAMGGTEAVAALRAALANVDGDIESTAARDNGGISIRTTSAIGNPILVGAVTVGAAVALPALVRARAEASVAQRSDAGGVEPSAELRALLRQLGEAQQAHRSESQDGTFATLDELAATGRVAGDDLGKAIGNGVFRRGDYLITALLPESPAERQQHFALLAWPADQRRGSVLAATPTAPLMINRAIAASAGIRMIEPTDLFLSGQFGTAMVPGWRETTDTPQQVPLAQARDQLLMDAILHAEQKRPRPLPKEVLEGLASENPRVAARAAWAVGSLGAIESVPKLCELVESYPDVEVRRQAMAALGRMGDQRSIRASMHALASDDALLRALAAANLGRVRATESTNELLSVVGRESSGDESDRLAALLALADIGSADTLLPAAAAVTATSGRLADGIAFAFQSITPKLEPQQEAKVLMAVLDHPSTVLRRYAIQRLGQLKNPATRPALEGRLGAENDPSLRPLIEASLLVLRGTPPASGEQPANPLASVTTLWHQLTPQQRGMVGAGAGSFVVLVLGFVVFRARRRRALQAAQWAAFTAPSDEYEQRSPGLFENEVARYQSPDEVPGLHDEYAEATEETEETQELEAPAGWR